MELEDAFFEMRLLAIRDPIKFAREVLQLRTLPGEPSPGDPNYNPLTSWEMDEWQCEMLEAMADVWRKKRGRDTRRNHDGRNFITVRACQGPGKTFGIAVAAHIWGMGYDPSVVACLAPKLDHLKTRFMGEFSKITYRAIPGYAKFLDIKATGVTWKTEDPINHFLTLESAKQPESIQGLRRKSTLFLADESSGIEENLFPVIEGNMSGTDHCVAIFIGNPTRNDGYFARSHLDKRTDGIFYRMKVGPGDSRRIKQVWMDRMEKLYGKDSPAYKVRVLGEFADASPRQLVPLEWLDRARLREFPVDGSFRRLRISLDVADGGTDECVATVAEHFSSFMRVLKFRRASFPMSDSPIMCADMAEVLFKAYGGRKDSDDMVVDGLGVGAGTAGTLRARGYYVVVHRGGEGSDQPDRWRNKRVQAHYNTRDALRDNLVCFADDCFDSADDWDTFCAQACSIQLPERGSERVDDIETKADLVKRTGKSPDVWESFVMQWATQSRGIEPGEMVGLGSSGDSGTVIESNLLEGLD